MAVSSWTKLMPKKNKTITCMKRIPEFIAFLNLGFKDYIAARTLIRSDLLLQGSTLAATSVEKYFKAILAFNGQKREGHLCKGLRNCIRSSDQKLYEKFDASFLEYLQRCYKLRYFDSIPLCYSIKVHGNRLLAEIDYTVHLIQSRFNLRNGKNKVTMEYDAYVEGKNLLLYQDNYIFQHVDKSEFLSRESKGYAMRYDQRLGMMEVYYTAAVNQPEDDFLAEGLIPAP